MSSDQVARGGAEIAELSDFLYSPRTPRLRVNLRNGTE